MLQTSGAWRGHRASALLYLLNDILRISLQTANKFIVIMRRNMGYKLGRPPRLAERFLRTA